MARRSPYAARAAQAKRIAAKERRMGFSRAEAGREWLRLTPAERREFEATVQTSADLATWLKESSVLTNR